MHLLLTCLVGWGGDYSGAPRARARAELVIYPNFGSHVTVRPSVHPPAHQSVQIEINYYTQKDNCLDKLTIKTVIRGNVQRDDCTKSYYSFFLNRLFKMTRDVTCFEI